MKCFTKSAMSLSASFNSFLFAPTLLRSTSFSAAAADAGELRCWSTTITAEAADAEELRCWLTAFSAEAAGADELCCWSPLSWVFDLFWTEVHFLPAFWTFIGPRLQNLASGSSSPESDWNKSIQNEIKCKNDKYANFKKRKRKCNQKYSEGATYLNFSIN